MALSSLDLVKHALSIQLSSTKLDAALTAALAAADAYVLAQLGLTSSDPTSYTLVADADDDPCGHDLVEFGPRPVISIDELRNRSTVISPDNYRLIGKRLVRRYHAHWHGVRQSGTHPFGADITAGFDPVPDDLAWGVAEWAAAIHTVKPGVAEEAIGKYRVKFVSPGEAGLPPWPLTLTLAMGRFTDALGGYVPIALTE